MQDPSQQPASPPYPPHHPPHHPQQYPPSYPPPPVHTGPSRVKVWAAAAAVVSAIAGVASAIAAFSNGSPSPAAVSPPSSTTVTVQPPQNPTGSAAGPASGAAGAGSVRWSGKVLLGLEGLDLTQAPPRKGDGNSFGYRPAAGRTGENSMEVKGTAALWTEAAEPTAQGCKDLLATQSRKTVVVAEGDSVCLVNESSPIGVLKVTATHYDEGTYGLIEGQLTIWNLRAAR